MTSSVELGYHFAVDHNCTCDEVKERWNVRLRADADDLGKLGTLPDGNG